MHNGTVLHGIQTMQIRAVLIHRKGLSATPLSGYTGCLMSEQDRYACRKKSGNYIGKTTNTATSPNAWERMIAENL